ncbi:hypothetical protein RCCGE510_06472 [Rhizobium sp. CCGE 510]|nr:hypothetical protein RCCGE510_06472 [Rhizobium sp. CCGE 510]
MRLPEMRTLIMEAREPRQLELFEAYQMAVEARDSVRRQGFNSSRVREYDQVCFEIEQHVIGAMHEPSYTTEQKAGEPS